jgi:hypothetical protein
MNNKGSCQKQKITTSTPGLYSDMLPQGYPAGETMSYSLATLTWTGPAKQAHVWSCAVLAGSHEPQFLHTWNMSKEELSLFTFTFSD